MLRAGDDGNNPDYGRLVVVLGSPTRRGFSMTAAVGAQKLSAGTWAIDPVHSSINFSVRHLMVGKIHGRFDQFSGAITITARHAIRHRRDRRELGRHRQRAA
jgi:YceI-like domain